MKALSVGRSGQLGLDQTAVLANGGSTHIGELLGINGLDQERFGALVETRVDSIAHSLGGHDDHRNIAQLRRPLQHGSGKFHKNPLLFNNHINLKRNWGFELLLFGALPSLF